MLLTLNQMGWGRFILYFIGLVTVLFLALPMVAIAALSFGSSQWMQFPPPHWTTRWYEQFLADPRWLHAFVTSARIAIVVTVLSVSLGLLASLALVRGSFRGRAALSSLFISPMIVPVVITAVSLYIVFLRIGLNGTFAGFVIGHLILALPFSVICITNSLRGFDDSIEKAAIICGATPFTAIRRVTIPSIRSGLLAGAVFSFLISWDEVVMSIFLASPDLKTLPVMIWTSLHQDLSPVVAAVSTVLIGITLIVIVLMALLQKDRP